MSSSELSSDDGQDLQNEANNSNVAIRDWGYHKQSFYNHDLQDIDLLENDEDAVAMAQLEEKELEEYRDRMNVDLSAADYDFFDFWMTDSPANSDMAGSATEKITLADKSDPSKLDFDSADSLDRHYIQTIFINDKMKNFKPDGDHSKNLYAVAKSLVLNLTFYQHMIVHYNNSQFLYNLYSHPVVSTLVQFLQLYQKLKDNLEQLSNEKRAKPSKNQSKIISSIDQSTKKNRTSKKRSLKSDILSKKKKLPTNDSTDMGDFNPLDYYNQVKSRKRTADALNNTNSNSGLAAADDNDSRPITYQMEKNKGLTKRSKREYKNPRVKHKIKFNKATIKHKSMVRTVRKLDSNYGGEARGINDKVVHSVKFK